MDQVQLTAYHVACLCIFKQAYKPAYQAATPISILTIRLLLAKIVIQHAQLVVQDLQTA